MHNPFPAEPGAPRTGWSLPLRYSGPERRRNLTLARLLAQALDEIDYGLLLMADSRQVLHANHVARAELTAQHPLQLIGGELRARYSHDVAPLHDAIHGATSRGLRRLLALGEDGQRMEVSVVALGGTTCGAGPVGALLVLSRRQVCGTLSAQGFARAYRLSPGEECVLQALCEGLSPGEVAERHGVKIATVRTQIASIRAKTGSESIRDLVHQVARLPPMVSALRTHANLLQGLMATA